MDKKAKAVVSAVLVLCIIFVGYIFVDTIKTKQNQAENPQYYYAYLTLPDGSSVEGTATTWMLLNGGVLKIEINEITYILDSKNVVLTKGEKQE